jgi:MEMO1 family protein
VQTAPKSANVRPPAVAGQFYPGHPQQLRTNVTDLLAKAAVPGDLRPKALIAPHAGYIYSGAVAASAFATLRDHGNTIKRVVVIGPAHYVAVRGIAIPTCDAFATPLGQVPVDRDALAVIGDLPFVARSDKPHAPEHALEVELPFLEMVLGSFTLVPLVIGDAKPQEVAEVLRLLWGGGETLIVVSSDLSHYYDYAAAQRLDAATAAMIECGDWVSLGSDNACGHLAIAGLLIECARHGLGARRLALANSGDTAGTRDRVVGYGAWAWDAPGETVYPSRNPTRPPPGKAASLESDDAV